MRNAETGHRSPSSPLQAQVGRISGLRRPLHTLRTCSGERGRESGDSTHRSIDEGRNEREEGRQARRKEHPKLRVSLDRSQGLSIDAIHGGTDRVLTARWDLGTGRCGESIHFSVFALAVYSRPFVVSVGFPLLARAWPLLESKGRGPSLNACLPLARALILRTVLCRSPRAYLPYDFNSSDIK